MRTTAAQPHHTPHLNRSRPKHYVHLSSHFRTIPPMHRGEATGSGGAPSLRSLTGLSHISFLFFYTFHIL